MPFDLENDVMVFYPRGFDADGNLTNTVIVHVRATELHRLGLHPDKRCQ